MRTQLEVDPKNCNTARRAVWITAAGLLLVMHGAAVAEDLPPPPALPEAGAGILIRPANYDPADEWAYTRQKGEVAPGRTASGQVWNEPAIEARVIPASADSSGENAGPAPAALGPAAPRMSYAAAYSQIPFVRSEYEANPSYRHDAAMELMMGTMRPPTVMRSTPQYFSRYPDMFRYKYPVYPYPFSGGSGTSNLNMYWNTSLIAY